MPMSNSSRNNLLQLIFNNVAWADIGNVAGLQPSGVAGNLYVALHTADPGAAGTQATSEISYTGYARVAVARVAGAWAIAGNQVSNNATTQFGEMTAGAGGSVTYFSVGSGSSGATEILASGQLTSPRAVSNGITPLFNAGSLTGTVT
jgi:hypothetical protein